MVQGEPAPVRVPHVVEFVEDLPRTPTGKVQRYKLREAEQVRATLAGAGRRRVRHLVRSSGEIGDPECGSHNLCLRP